MSSKATRSEFVVGVDASVAPYAAVSWAAHEATMRGLPAPEAATALAFDEASCRRVPLVALHARSDVGVFPILGMDWRVDRDEEDVELGERLTGWRGIYPDVQVHRRLVCDVPARWLVDESSGAQLVVPAHRGPRRRLT